VNIETKLKGMCSWCRSSLIFSYKWVKWFHISLISTVARENGFLISILIMYVFEVNYEKNYKSSEMV